MIVDFFEMYGRESLDLVIVRTWTGDPDPTQKKHSSNENRTGCLGYIKGMKYLPVI